MTQIIQSILCVICVIPIGLMVPCDAEVSWSAEQIRFRRTGSIVLLFEINPDSIQLGLKTNILQKYFALLTEVSGKE